LWTFDGYSECTARTDKVKDLWYYALGLTGESGELVEVLKKYYRDVKVNDLDRWLTDAETAKIVDEAGDVLWYLSRLLEKVGSSLDAAADGNIKKLRKRASAGTLTEVQRPTNDGHYSLPLDTEHPSQDRA